MRAPYHHEGGWNRIASGQRGHGGLAHKQYFFHFQGGGAFLDIAGPVAGVGGNDCLHILLRQQVRYPGAQMQEAVGQFYQHPPAALHRLTHRGCIQLARQW